MFKQETARQNIIFQRTMGIITSLNYKTQLKGVKVILHVKDNSILQ